MLRYFYQHNYTVAVQIVWQMTKFKLDKIRVQNDHKYFVLSHCYNCLLYKWTTNWTISNNQHTTYSVYITEKYFYEVNLGKSQMTQTITNSLICDALRRPTCLILPQL